MYFKRATTVLAFALLSAWQSPVMAAQVSKVKTLPAPGSPVKTKDDTNTANSVNASTQTLPVLSVQPATCVALHQGRTCFAQLSLNWQSTGAGDFCIYLKDSKQPVRCWKNSRGNLTSFEFESDKKVVFQLIEQGKNHVVAETSVDVSWVHKAAPRKRRWRIF
ncbi:DUF3019 domain-containing protein [Thalassomonas actiniarum]|uniref:DUF3019 domain-containing protein n=1 Tax=Thalassomonas actiniarum TaxID=485447 RepID=A0AAF0C3B2_9GAMM|nr:DUF3019 domain-containing protein [Thalassomonas actiniarum]WDD98499.1 DUF3019 domain-containing protein [Thalassomonas actiniarum]